MSKQHILHTLLDDNHVSLVMVKNKRQLIGAATFKLFPKKRFIELVFFAIKQKYQGQKFGSILMRALKNQMWKIDIKYILTYADDLAKQFFYRHSFHQKLTIQHKQFQDFIKKYDGGTLMQCKILGEVEIIKSKIKQKIIPQNQPNNDEKVQQDTKQKQQNSKLTNCDNKNLPSLQIIEQKSQTVKREKSNGHQKTVKKEKKKKEPTKSEIFLFSWMKQQNKPKQNSFQIE